MSAIFKEKIVPKLKIESLDASETNALIQVLELIDCKETTAYTQAKNNIDGKITTPLFTKTLAQQLYHNPEIYASEKEGLEYVGSWLPLLEQGFFPDEKSSLKLKAFLSFSLSFFQSEAISEPLRTQVFLVLKTLVQSKSEASLTITKFLIHTALDIRDTLGSDFIIQNCISHNILNTTYNVSNSDNEFIAFPFKINNDFVQHFYEGDWYKLVIDLHQILPVGKIEHPAAYNLMLPWFSTDLAAFYNENLEFAVAAQNAIKDRLIFVEEKSLELLNIQTADGLFPLITAFGTKKWDSADVLLFNNRDKNIPQEQLDASFIRFLDWLEAEGGSHFYTQAFQVYGKHILSDNTAKLPLKFLSFWFKKCHPKTRILNQVELYNTLFSSLLKELPNGKLPVMRIGSHDFQVTGEYNIKDVFQITNNIKEWLGDFMPLGIKDPLNQFIVLSFYDARKALATIKDETHREALQLYLLEMAYATRKASEDIKKSTLPLIVHTLTTICTAPGNYIRVNEIWALKNIDHSVLELCEDFAAGHYVNVNRPLDLNLIQTWFNYLGDFYYSLREEASWISQVLNTQGPRTANYFNCLEENVTFFLDRAIFRIVSIHKKCRLRESTNGMLSIISNQIEVFLMEFLNALNEDKLAKQTVKYLYDYSRSPIAGLDEQKELLNAIDKFYHFHFVQEPQTETNALLELLKTDDIALESIKIDEKHIGKVLHNLQNYKTVGICDIQLLEVLDEKISDFKALLAEDELQTEAKFHQALYMTLLDKNLAPGTVLEPYGNLCRKLFVHLTKGSKMASSYTLGLKAMAKSGAYPETLTTTLLQVIEDLNA
ncbi:hypothetical protein [Formosa sp. L2A11]|uniref:hypothetical protein n=1 Tax=Formosa sp. L2A11 TaxID=2686363 RepID=UPI00131A769C|nr:hypothetical protein [Formosa sp. L2A11]